MSAPARPAAPRGRFLLRLTLVMVALVLVPAGVIGAFGLRRYRAALEEQARDDALTALDDLAQVADQELRDVQDQLDILAGVLANAQTSAGDRLQEARAMLTDNLTVGVVAIYDQAGQRIGALRKPTEELELPERLPAALSAAGERRFQTGTALPSRQGPRVPVARRLTLPTETWTLVAPVAMKRLGERIARLAETRFGGAVDSLLVLDTELRVVASPDLERIGSQLPRPAWLSDRDLDALRANVVFRGGRATDERGAHLVAARRLEIAPLLFIAQLDEGEVLAPVRELRVVVIGVSVAAAALALLVGLWWSRRAAAPIASLAAFADELAARRFDRRVVVQSGDELETLAAAFNDAAAALARGESELEAAAAIRADLSRFLPAQLVERVVRREHELELGGQRRVVTVLFADVAGFTSLVERHTPEVVIPVLHELFTLLTEIIFRHHGTVDKFIGDCVMAMWNAPNPDDDHAAAAVRCAQDMLRWVELANAIWQRRVGVTIHLAIGVHTGEATVGNFGSRARMEYTAIGDTVNVASRLEHLARPQQILVGASTVEAAPSAGSYVALGATRLPGRERPIEIYEVIAD
ncbi:MAG: adenylate/guanylate cyclase domain-containing protein [Kofleriaceae bacterium]